MVSSLPNASALVGLLEDAVKSIKAAAAAAESSPKPADRKTGPTVGDEFANRGDTLVALEAYTQCSQKNAKINHSNKIRISAMAYNAKCGFKWVATSNGKTTFTLKKLTPHNENCLCPSSGCGPASQKSLKKRLPPSKTTQTRQKTNC